MTVISIFAGIAAGYPTNYDLNGRGFAGPRSCITSFPAVASTWVFMTAIVGRTRVVKNIIEIAASPNVDLTSYRDIRESVGS